MFSMILSLVAFQNIHIPEKTAIVTDRKGGSVVCTFTYLADLKITVMDGHKNETALEYWNRHDDYLAHLKFMKRYNETKNNPASK